MFLVEGDFALDITVRNLDIICEHVGIMLVFNVKVVNFAEIEFLLV